MFQSAFGGLSSTGCAPHAHPYLARIDRRGAAASFLRSCHRGAIIRRGSCRRGLHALDSGGVRFGGPQECGE